MKAWKQICVVMLLFCAFIHVDLSAQSPTKKTKKGQMKANGKASRLNKSSSSDSDRIGQIFSSATKVLQQNRPNNDVQFLYTVEDVETLIKAKQTYIDTEGRDESYTQRSRKIYASYWKDKLESWKTGGYQPVLDIKQIQSHYQYELGNLGKANANRLIALQAELNMVEKSSKKYIELFPNEPSVKKALDNIIYLKKKLEKEMNSTYSKNMTSTFHKENAGKLLFSEKPILIGKEDPSQFSNTITLNANTDGVNKGFHFVYYDYQTHREKNIAKVTYSILIEGGAPFCGEGKREIVNTKAYDEAYFNENLLLDLSTYNTDNYAFVADNDKKVLAACLGALLPGEYTLNLSLFRGSGTMPIKQSVKVIVEEGFDQFTQKIQNKIEEASINDMKFEKEFAASQKYIPFIKEGLAKKGEKGIIKIVPISGWNDLEIKQKDALGRPYVVERYSLLVFEYSFKGGDGKFYLKKGALRKPFKGSDSAKKMDYTTQFTQAGRGPWQMSKENAY
ncbi:hypothetical protein ABN763_15640 [Spongiivirga sp. MCCC 1A20706]|uniref:hypothetical protein n=1 Tax=Spongiivirga sp. MCCC 1A20706 TaxID=3160963 RepID=UPI003977DE44